MKYLKSITLGLCIGFVVMIVGQYLFMFFYWKPRIEESTSKGRRHLAAIIADARRIAGDPLFKFRPRNKNAESLLSEYLSFRLYDEVVISAPKKSQLLEALFAEHRDWATSNDAFNKLLNDP